MSYLSDLLRKSKNWLTHEAQAGVNFVRQNLTPISYVQNRVVPQVRQRIQQINRNIVQPTIRDVGQTIRDNPNPLTVFKATKTYAPDRQENIDLFNKAKAEYNLPESWRKYTPAVIPRTDPSSGTALSGIQGYAKPFNNQWSGARGAYVYNDTLNPSHVATHEMQHMDTFRNNPGSWAFPAWRLNDPNNTGDSTYFAKLFPPEKIVPEKVAQLQASLSPDEKDYLDVVSQPYGEEFWNGLDEPVSWLKTYRTERDQLSPKLRQEMLNYYASISKRRKSK